MLSDSARVRPSRSATTPKITPPTADATSVSEPRYPAVVSEIPKARTSSASTSEYSITSKASSIQPSDAASSARRASGEASRQNAGTARVVVVIAVRGLYHAS